jgi:hypothetical protein
LFRSAASEDLPDDLSNLSSLRVEDLCRSVASKIVELQILVTQPESKLSMLTPRLRTRISHLRGHLTHLTTLGLFPSNIATWHNQELHDQLDRIEQHIASLEVADQQGQEQAAQEDMHNMAQGASRTQSSLLAGKMGDRLGADDRQDTGDVSTVTAAVTKPTEALPITVFRSECLSCFYSAFLSEVATSPESLVERTPCGRWHRCKSYV